MTIEIATNHVRKKLFAMRVIPNTQNEKKVKIFKFGVQIPVCIYT